MRQVLVAFARRRNALKRNGQSIRLSLVDAERALELELDQIVAVDDALQQLDGINQRLRQIVELRFFGGLSEPEIAEMLGVSSRTVERDWLKARMFLVQELREAGSGVPLARGA
jgi:RNA polymerase sigma factor (TIGR02999 family)